MWRCPRCVAHIEDARTACTSCGAGRSDISERPICLDGSDLTDLPPPEPVAVRPLPDVEVHWELTTSDAEAKPTHRFPNAIRGFVAGVVLGEISGAMCVYYTFSPSTPAGWLWAWDVAGALLFMQGVAAFSAFAGMVTGGFYDALDIGPRLIYGIFKWFRPQERNLTGRMASYLERQSPVTRYTSDTSEASSPSSLLTPSPLNQESPDAIRPPS